MAWKGRLEPGESWKTSCVVALEFAFISEFIVVFKQRSGVMRTKYRENGQTE